MLIFKQVLLKKSELDHRATKRACMRDLSSLLVNSLPNITRFTEVSGVEKVSRTADKEHTADVWVCRPASNVMVSSQLSVDSLT